MRPARLLGLVLLFLLALDGGLLIHGHRLRVVQLKAMAQLAVATSAMGLTDLALSTEARYTRHPAASDPMAPFMDHPGAIEHFPSGSFWAPPYVRTP